MDKNEYIQNLKKVKLVLGNGFDLHRKLITKHNGGVKLINIFIN